MSKYTAVLIIHTITMIIVKAFSPENIVYAGIILSFSWLAIIAELIDDKIKQDGRRGS